MEILFVAAIACYEMIETLSRGRLF